MKNPVNQDLVFIMVSIANMMPSGRPFHARDTLPAAIWLGLDIETRQWIGVAFNKHPALACVCLKEKDHQDGTTLYKNL